MEQKNFCLDVIFLYLVLKWTTNQVVLGIGLASIKLQTSRTVFKQYRDLKAHGDGIKIISGICNSPDITACRHVQA